MELDNSKTSDKKILKQCSKILDRKISDCYEHIKNIEDNSDYFKTFIFMLDVRGAFEKKELDQMLINLMVEAEYLKFSKKMISNYELIQKTIDNKLEEEKWKNKK